MARLLINPDTPHAWELQLKPGTHVVGRAEGNDLLIPHPSVSSTHCQITVDDLGAHIRDLGSSNGTFVDRAPVTESRLRSGQRLQLGAVDMVYDHSGPASAPAPVFAPPAVRVTATPRLSINPAPQIEETARYQSDEPPPPMEAPPIPVRVTTVPAHQESSSAHPPVPVAVPATSRPLVSHTALFCKFHPKSPARFFCRKCNKHYCDMCVGSRTEAAGAVKFCRACGSHVQPVQLRLAPRKEKSFYSRVPGAFVYPFLGIGPMILIFATIIYAILGWRARSLFMIFYQATFYGFLFLFMQNILHVTNSDENEHLSFPDPSSLVGAALQLLGTVLMSYGIAIGLVVARLCEVDVPPSAILAAFIFGCVYFPMAFLAAAMKDSVAAANPLVVIPSIMKIPLEYLITAVLMMAVFGVRAVGELISGAAGTVSLTTRDMSVLFMAFGYEAIWSFISMYLLTVNVRILGLLYISKKDELDWF